MRGLIMRGVEVQLGRLLTSGTLTGLSDTQLLEQFASRGDESAFAALMERHGPLVLGLCRKLLRDPNDAEDALQATFLVLARKAGSIRTSDTLASWLCRVAYRIAVRAGAASNRRRDAERRGAAHDAGTASRDHGDRPGADELAILFDELDGLPDRYRTPIVLCHLEGLTAEAAALRIGCPVGTVWGRLSRARARLRRRLVKRGLVLSAGVLVSDLSLESTRAAVPASMTETTVHAALKFVAIDALTAGVTSSNVATLTNGALSAMLRAQLKMAVCIVLVVGLFAGVGVGVLARGAKLLAPKRQAAPQQAARTQQVPERPGRTLRFPADRALGIIYVRHANELDLASTEPKDAWRRLGEARGVVPLPPSGLVRLDLSNAALADLSPLDQLAPDAIHSLRLDKLGAHDDAIRHVGRLQGLKEVVLDGNFITDASLKHLSGLEQLESISASDSLIGDNGIRHIAGLRSVRRVSLYRSRITDEALRILGNMKSLVSLELGVTAITDRGIGHLRDLKNLRYIGFSETNTTDSSLALVGGLNEIESLYIDRTRTTDAGLAHLTGLKKLRWFRAYSNPFTDLGLTHIAQLPALEYLYVGHGTRFTDAGLASLENARALKALHMSSGKFSDIGVMHLAKLPALEDLRLSGSNGAVTGEGMVSLSRISTLKRLQLDGCAVGGAGLKALSALPSLEALLLDDQVLTFADLAQLGKFANLRDLRLFRMSADPGHPTLRAFRNLRSLTFLELPHRRDTRGPRDGFDFDPAEFANLSGLTKLENFEHAGKITDEGLKHLAPLTAMTDMRLRNPHISDDGLKGLSGMVRLEFLVIGGPITDQGLHHLEALKSLRFLSLEDTRTVSREALNELKAKLPTLHTVLPFDNLNTLFQGPKMGYSRVGENAPDFTLTTRVGKPFHLADQRGKVVLVHFWGPNCAPCIRALPKLKEIHQELSRRPDRFAMIGLTIGMGDKEWHEFLNGHEMDWPQALLTEGDEKAWDHFHVRGIPDYVVIGADGKIVADGESAERDVEKLKTAILKAIGP
jgi:RNA polymerase sigma factor (sigma-70 family)